MRGRGRRGVAAGALALLAVLLPLLAASAAGQALLVQPQLPAEGFVDVAPGRPFAVTVVVSNAGDDGLAVLATASGPQGWNVTVAPASLLLPPQAEGEVRRFEVLVAPPDDAAPGAYRADLVIAAANSTTGAADVQRVALPLQVTHSARVLGLWPNPLGPPLDNAYGVFALNLAFWTLVAALLLLLHGPAVRWLARKAEERVAARIVHMLRAPLFLAVVFFGLLQAWGALPPSGPADLGRRVLAAGAIVVTVYVAYKLWRAATVYYLENIATRTSTDIDDVLIPVLDKVGAVAIIFVGGLYFIGSLGIDLTTFVAGGVVVSMVLAFAAQDTLSNFFAGLFLMLDRPFSRGDDILLVSGTLQQQRLRVDDVGLRTTRLYHYDNHQLVVVPNNDLVRNAVINLTHPDLLFRCMVDVGVGYDSDPRRVQELLLEVARAHPEFVEGPRPARARLQRFGDNGLEFRLMFFVRDARRRSEVMSEVRIAVLEAFRREGITIPYPQRVLHWEGPGPDGTPAPGPGAPPGAREPAKR